jgi:hypothetical protein
MAAQGENPPFAAKISIANVQVPANCLTNPRSRRFADSVDQWLAGLVQRSFAHWRDARNYRSFVDGPAEEWLGVAAGFILVGRSAIAYFLTKRDRQIPICNHNESRR